MIGVTTAPSLSWAARLPVCANTFSTPCDVVAPATAVCTLAELDHADLSGRAAILYGDLASITLSPKGWFLKSERDDRIIMFWPLLRYIK